MKRVLCLISSMNTGGAETFLMKVYRRLDRTQYQMDFCVNVEKEGFYEKEIRELGGKIYRIPPKSQDLKGFKKGLYDLVKKEGYEYVLRITSNAAGFMDLKIAKSAGARVTVARSSNSSDGESLKSKVINEISRLLYIGKVDVKIAPSDLAAEYTFGKRRVKKGDVKFLHNAVDLDVVKYGKTERANIRRELGIDDKLVVGHVGRLNRQKNHMFLLDIFAEIKKKNENAVLVLVGKGELEGDIKSKIDALGLTDSVIFTGVRADIPALMSAMDVFVFPSFYEGMPNTVIEAQAKGLPCVIADTITKEADITGLVKYLSLADSADKWADEALSLVSSERADTKQAFIDNKYDIDSTVEYFTELVFGKVK